MSESGIERADGTCPDCGGDADVFPDPNGTGMGHIYCKDDAECGIIHRFYPGVDRFIAGSGVGDTALEHVRHVAGEIAANGEDLEAAMIVTVDSEGVETHPYVTPGADPRELSLWMLGAFMAHIADAASNASGTPMTSLEAARHAAQLMEDPEPDWMGDRDA